MTATLVFKKLHFSHLHGDGDIGVFTSLHSATHFYIGLFSGHVLAYADRQNATNVLCFPQKHGVNGA